jgi:AcrR family transcriptional regulator
MDKVGRHDRVAPTPRPSAREELLTVALELMSRKGIGAVGIDELTRTAGRARDTLYRLFGSKTGLVMATLSRYGEQLPWLEFLRRAAADPRRPADPTARSDWARDKLFAVMDRVAVWSFQRGGRGCYLLTAAAEFRDDHEQTLTDVDREAALEVIRTFHNEARRLLADLAEAAGAADSAMLADDLHLEIVGILTRAAVQQPPSRADARRVAQRAAERVLAFHHIAS